MLLLMLLWPSAEGHMSFCSFTQRDPLHTAHQGCQCHQTLQRGWCTECRTAGICLQIAALKSPCMLQSAARWLHAHVGFNSSTACQMCTVLLLFWCRCTSLEFLRIVAELQTLLTSKLAADSKAPKAVVAHVPTSTAHMASLLTVNIWGKS